MSNEPFKIDPASLKKRKKAIPPDVLEKVDKAADEAGFVSREKTGKGRRGRKKSPRTGQVHAKVLPSVQDEIADEALRRGVTQGILIEEAWALYKARGEVR